jgi:hypothetical protein
MCALIHDLLFDSRHSVEYNGARSAFDVVDGRLDYRGADGSRDEPAEEGRGDGSHGDVLEFDVVAVSRREVAVMLLTRK